MTYLLLSSAAFAAGEYASKLYATGPTPKVLLLLFIAYNAGVLLWLPAISARSELAVLGSIWSVLSLLATVFMGAFVFQERLTSPQVIGIGMALIAVYLLSK